MVGNPLRHLLYKRIDALPERVRHDDFVETTRNAETSGEGRESCGPVPQFIEN